MRRTVFWRVAGVLVGAQLATALVALGLAVVFAEARSRELVAGTLRQRLDAVAEEIETRAEIGPFGGIELGPRLRQDLPERFPDPVVLLDAEGRPAEAFGGAAPAVPDGALEALAAARVVVDVEGGWGLAPVLAPDGLPAGAVFVAPLGATLAEERAGPRRAFALAMGVTAVLATLLALGLGALLTARLIRPVREVTRRVERLGDGDYAARLPVRGDAARADELGRLALAVNELAARVEASVESLRATDRLRRELVANVGHDLRTPLAALGAHLEEAERLGAEGRADEAAAALAAARRLAHTSGALVADLFELSVLDAPDRRAAWREPVPLGELAADLAARYRPEAGRAGVDLRLDAAPGLPVVSADGARLSRALANLLDNALRHTPPGGTVTLGARRVPLDGGGEGVELSVADTGEGIDPERLPHVFDRYYRGSDARTRAGAGGGTGLGLAIARAVAEAHGGTLDVESRPGEGATFRLRLPLDGAAVGEDTRHDAPARRDGRPHKK